MVVPSLLLANKTCPLIQRICSLSLAVLFHTKAETICSSELVDQTSVCCSNDSHDNCEELFKL